MAGFGKVTFVGEFFNQAIVNIFRYRSDTWVPGQGNPFDDVLAFVDGVVNHLKSSFLSCMSSNYTLLRAEGVGYNDDYSVATSSPLVRTIGETGLYSAGATNGAPFCANLGLRCGEQVQINGTGVSARNRGYLAIGPLDDATVDNYHHITPGSTFLTNLNTFASKVDDTITIVLPAVNLIPIRIHEKWIRVPAPLPDVLLFRTYSDVKGYTMPRLASYRRSRRPEA